MGVHEPGEPKSATASRKAVESDLTSDRWQKIKGLFTDAQEHEPKDRSAYLRGACGGDEALLAEVESLLAAAASEETATAAMPPAQDPLVGRRIGAYKIERQIGSGGMASVYLACRADEEYQKQVAIKILRPELDSKELLRRFRNERQTLATLNHPHIVKLLDGGSTEEGLPYIVMDYVGGTPIDEFCDTHKLSIEERLRLFGEVCAGVECAHQNFVVHRDLKPNNILVTADGIPKVLDFGIAKVLSPPDSAQPQPITQTLGQRMTPAYASPEQVKGMPVTTATDIYSLGVVLYELLTGHRPYKLKQSTPAELERAICEEEPENPSTAVDRVESTTTSDGTTVTITPDLVSRTRESQPEKLRRRLRGDLDNIVLMALQKGTDRRYASVGALSEDIQRHLDHLPVKARPSTLAYRSTKFVKRHGTGVLTGALLVLVALCGAVFVRWEEKRAAEKARAEVGGEHMPGRRSVAVLGFKNVSGRPETSWVSTALSEMLTTELAAGGQLRTTPGESVAQMKINLALPEADALSRETLRRVRKNLNSDFVVLGSYLDQGEGSGHQIRLDLRLQDAVTGETLAAAADNGTEANLSDLVSRAGAALRSKLGAGEVSPGESASVKASLPSRPDAARLYAEGLARLRGFDALRSRDLLENAVLADPSFALTHSALADAWSALGYPAKAKLEAKKAFDVSGTLTREESLFVEARYRQTTGEHDKAIDLYRTLFNFFPDNLDYGLHLSAVQSSTGKAQDGLTTLDKLRQLPPPSGTDPRIDLSEAEAAKYTGDYKRQLAAATRAEEKGRAQGARLLVAQALVSEGEAYRSLGIPQKSTAASFSARQIFTTVGDRFGESRVLRNIGTVYFDQGDFENARESFEESMRIRHELGNRAGEAAMLTAVAITFQFQKDFKRAKEMYERSLVISRELGDKFTIGATLTNLGTLEKDAGDFTAAQRHLGESLAINREAGNTAGTGAVLVNLGLLALEQGEPAEAKRMLEESLAIARRGSDKNQLGVTLTDLASALQTTGNLSTALKLLAEARQVLTETKNEGAAANALLGVGTILFSQGDLAGARKTFEECLAIQERLKERGFAASTRMSLARLAVEEHRSSEAEVSVRQLIEQFQSQDDVNEQAEAEALLADILLGKGSIGEAQNAVAGARDLLSNSASVARGLAVTIVDGRIHSATGNSLQATNSLQDAVRQARKHGLLSLQFEARLALAEAEIKSGNSAGGRAQLVALERDAKVKGFALIAHKAAAARKQKTTSPRVADSQ